ncbi:MAG TPA: alpha/beta fold hydrolase [Devosia sp.]|nr:alpha/beta fold hydrolase [Devosia sp.]
MRTTDVTVASGDVRLSGTLAEPDGPAGAVPLVLFLGGSGPLDRDTNMRGQRLNAFPPFAADLAARGIASFRYDKRGAGKSTGDFFSAGQTEFLADAVAALDHFAEDPRFGRRFVLGHSEGTVQAARLSLERIVDGLVLLAPFIEDAETSLMKQAAMLDEALRNMPGVGGFLARLLSRPSGGPLVQQKKLIELVKGSDEAVIRRGLQRIDAKSLREIMALDLAAIYAQVRTPALVIGGSKDIQCDPADVGRIVAAIGPAATGVVVEDLTHVLRKDSGPPTFLSYLKLIRQPVEPEVLRLVGEWVAAKAS